MAGLLRSRLPELDLDAVPDPRAREGRWAVGQLLRATLVGLMAGGRSAWETEQLTATLSPAMRRLLQLPRRLADTTLRDPLCRPADLPSDPVGGRKPGIALADQVCEQDRSALALSGSSGRESPVPPASTTTPQVSDTVSRKAAEA